MGKAAATLAQRNARGFFRVIDQRSRHAMASIVTARREAAAIIRKQYPESQQAEALAELGDGADARDAADLFVRRCPQACLDAFSQNVGALRSREEAGDEIVVQTVRGTTLRLFKGTDTWYGLVWQTEALSRERDRAAAELEVVRANAETFSKRRALQ